jgi:hypothetical protein
MRSSAFKERIVHTTFVEIDPYAKVIALAPLLPAVPAEPSAVVALA